MNGIVIESVPLDKEAAKQVLQALMSVSITANSAASFLKILQSVQRIADGVDIVSQVE